MLKKINIIIAIILFAAFFLYGIHSLIYGSKRYQEEQDKYFAKVEYRFCGKMLSGVELSGGRFLIEMNVDSVFFVTNNISYNDNFVGLYSANNKKIFFVSYFNNEAFNEYKMPYIKVNSVTRTVEYIFNENIIISEPLRFFSLYIRYLKDIETEEMIRF